MRTGNEFPVSLYLIRKAARMGIPLSGTFELTSRCNFNCRMCYVHGQNGNAAAGRELTARQWLRIAEEAGKLGMLFVLLTGGEAMARKDFIEIYTGIVKMGVQVTINTNGSLLSEEVFRCFKTYPPHRINVSVYGASDAVYERICGVRAYEKVNKNIERLTRMGISVRILMAITPDNCQDMRLIYERSRSLGTLLEMTPYMFPQIRLQRAAGVNCGRFSPEEAGKYLMKKEKMVLPAEKFEKRSRYWLLDRAQAGESCMKQGGTVQCQAGRSAFWITWDGNMRPCGLMTEPEADVKDMGFAASWEYIRGAVSRIRLPLECSRCKDRDLCNVCAAMCQSETGRFDEKPEYICRMTAAAKEEYRKQAERGTYG